MNGFFAKEVMSIPQSGTESSVILDHKNAGATDGATRAQFIAKVLTYYVVTVTLRGYPSPPNKKGPQQGPFFCLVVRRNELPKVVHPSTTSSCDRRTKCARRVSRVAANQFHRTKCDGRRPVPFHPLVAEESLELSPHKLRAVPHVHGPTYLSFGQVKATVYALQTFFASTLALKCL